VLKAAKALIFVFFCIYMLPAGCSKNPSVVEYSYEDLIRSYVQDSEDGKALFSPDLYSSDAFAYGDAGERCFYIFDSTRRIENIAFGKNPKNIPPYDGVYDALVTITDKYYGSMMRVNGADTVRGYDVQNTVTRYGYFIKPFDDWYPYRGWEIWGFIGGKYTPDLPAGNRLLSGQSGASMPEIPPLGPPPSIGSNYSSGYYINFDDIKKFPPGDSMTLASHEKDLVFVEGNAGAIKPFNLSAAGNDYKAGWRIPAETDKVYHLLTFDRGGYFVVDTVGQAVESTLIKTDDYVIPYGISL